jgi:hypothetical protein
MALFKNRLGIAIASIILILVLSIYHKPVRRIIHEKFQDANTTESKDLCSLDCTNKEIMNTVKRQFETKYVEGFTATPVEEAFQDPTQLLSLIQNPQALTNLPLAGLPGISGGTPTNLSALGSLPTGGSLPNLGAFSSFLGTGSTAISIPGFSPAAQLPPQLNRNRLKKIRRAFKIDETKCEYNIEYDESKLKSDGTLDERKDIPGYIQATFIRESKEKCDYKPAEVKLLIGPAIIRYDSANPDNIVPTIDYVF